MPLSLLDLYAPGHLERGSVWFNALRPLLLGVPLCTLRLVCRSLALQTHVRAGSPFRASVTNPCDIEDLSCTRQCEALLGHLRREETLDELTLSALRSCSLPVLRWLMEDTHGSGPLCYGPSRTLESWVYNRDAMVKVAESGDTVWLKRWLCDWATVFVLPEISVFVALLRDGHTYTDQARADVAAYAQGLQWSYWNQRSHMSMSIHTVIWEAAVIAGHVPTLETLRAQQLKGTVELNMQWQFAEIGSVPALEWLRKIHAPSPWDMTEYARTAAMRGDVQMLEHMMRKNKHDSSMYKLPANLLVDTITAGQSEAAVWLLMHTREESSMSALMRALQHADWDVVQYLWGPRLKPTLPWVDRFRFAQGLEHRQLQMIKVIELLAGVGAVLGAGTLVAAYGCEYHLVVVHMQNKKLPGVALPAAILANWTERSASFNEYLAEHMVSEHAWGPGTC